jgi:hypothetical protein
MQRLGILALIFIISCKPDYKKCNCESKDEVQKAYSEILNEIVEQRAFRYYLGEDGERIFNTYSRYRGDSSKVRSIDRDVIRLQNRIFNDTTRFCTLFLDTVATWKFKSRICCIDNNASRMPNEIRMAIDKISADPKPVLESLSTIQTRYLPKDLTLCTSKMKIHTAADSICNPCCIGTIRLSNISFNTALNKGLLYYEFAGYYGSLISIEKVNGRWEIKNSMQIWVF